MLNGSSYKKVLSMAVATCLWKWIYSIPVRDGSLHEGFNFGTNDFGTFLHTILLSSHQCSINRNKTGGGWHQLSTQNRFFSYFQSNAKKKRVNSLKSWLSIKGLPLKWKKKRTESFSSKALSFLLWHWFVNLEYILYW